MVFIISMLPESSAGGAASGGWTGGADPVRLDLLHEGTPFEEHRPFQLKGVLKHLDTTQKITFEMLLSLPLPLQESNAALKNDNQTLSLEQTFIDAFSCSQRPRSRSNFPHSVWR
jgi:hypothetical protein